MYKSVESDILINMTGYFKIYKMTYIDNAFISTFCRRNLLMYHPEMGSCLTQLLVHLITHDLF